MKKHLGFYSWYPINVCNVLDLRISKFLRAKGETNSNCVRTHGNQLPHLWTKAGNSVSLGGIWPIFFWQTFLWQVETHQEAVFLMASCWYARVCSHQLNGMDLMIPASFYWWTNPGLSGSGVEIQLSLVSNPSYCNNSRDLCEPCQIIGQVFVVVWSIYCLCFADGEAD